MTEDKLKQATKDLKNIGDSAMSEKEEQKVAIRQKMARKMRTVKVCTFCDDKHFPDLVCLRNPPLAIVSWKYF